MKLSKLKSKPVQHQIAEYLAGKVRMQGFADTLLEDKCHLIFKNYRVEQGVPVGGLEEGPVLVHILQLLDFAIHNRLLESDAHPKPRREREPDLGGRAV